MNLTSILSVAIIILLLTCSFLMAKVNRIKKQSLHILSVLSDIATGNLGRRVVSHGEKITDEICYQINLIAQTYQNQLSQAAKTEMTNRQLMTTLSHDVRTPLTTLIGYLDAIQDNVVIGAEREQYIETARAKAYSLKGYTDDLFELFKLNSKEREYRFEKVDISEISRNVLADWIPRLETMGFSYSVDIGTVSRTAVSDALEFVSLPCRDKKPFSNYSLGMKQRLGIANALMNDPGIINGLFWEAGVEVSALFINSGNLEEHFKTITGGVGIA